MEVGTIVGLTTAQILSILEEDLPNEPTDIVLVPPDENNVVRDEDNDIEEGSPKDLNHIGSRLMNQQAEMEKHTSQDNDKEMVSWLEEESVTADNLPIDINEVDELVEKIVKETKRYLAQENCHTFQTRVDRDLIRASHAIMLMSGYITPAQ
ncbi:hypothetical protein Pcinc_015151 [Petrolisthes cinctipes]|uniref:Uncharacterized protein n=1 Tax=Petrolisthes cinctipes TaxID=88211 RepID=A0AAE1FVK3_PETCI|nr:hypothetical protein Pcinc_015151 [Petrolisthes cinctipes]